MGNVFKASWALGAALLLCACGGNEVAQDSQSTLPPPYPASLSPAPTPALPPPGGDEAAAPTGVATPTKNDEGPAAGSGTPIAPPAQTGGSGMPPAQQTPPPAQPTPPDQTPPDQPPPAQLPPAQMPPPATARTQVFLLFGQSNMWGVPRPEQQDLAINPRVEVLTVTTCARHGTNQWLPAQPPLHGCVGQPGNGGQGPGVGPGDYFGKAMADAFPEDTILLVPAAVPGVSIDTFQPGQQNYNNLLTRAKLAQQRGEIRGMIFHQGESDSGQGTWPNRVKTVVDRLRADLGIANAPFVAGELLYSPAGCCGGHNTLVNQLPNSIARAAVAKADGFTAVPKSQDTFGNLHFDLPSQRTFGRRYAAAMLTLLGND